MFSDAQNQIIVKKNMKENWKIKGKIIYQKSYYCKRRRDYRIKEKIKMENKNKSYI